MLKLFILFFLIFQSVGFERAMEQSSKSTFQNITPPNFLTHFQALYSSPFIAALQSSLASTFSPKWQVDPSLTPCYQFLLAFSNTAGSFTSCALLNSQPFRLCEKCSNWYQESISLYNQLISGSFNNGTNGTSCKTYLLESVSFSIIDEIYRHMTIDLWNKAQCDNCYQTSSQDDGEVDYTQYSPCYQTFHQLVDNFTYCISNFNEPSLIPIDPSGSSRSRYDPSNPVCLNCSSIYAALTRQFEACGCLLMDRSRCCRDVIEAMNVTQYQWTFANCVPYDPDTVAVLAITGILLSATVAFYIAIVLLERFRGHPSRAIFGIFATAAEPTPRTASIGASGSYAPLDRGSMSALSGGEGGGLADVSVNTNTDSVLPTFEPQTQQQSLNNDPPHF